MFPSQPGVSYHLPFKFIILMTEARREKAVNYFLENDEYQAGS
jgi:hypothetical protein